MTDFRTKDYYPALLRSFRARMAIQGETLNDAINSVLRRERFRSWAQIGAADCLYEDLKGKE